MYVSVAHLRPSVSVKVCVRRSSPSVSVGLRERSAGRPYARKYKVRARRGVPVTHAESQDGAAILDGVGEGRGADVASPRSRPGAPALPLAMDKRSDGGHEPCIPCTRRHETTLKKRTQK